nr:methyltransferase domain-containing protein [Paenibacillus lentus]
MVGNATDFSLNQKVDAVFSNAALHLMKDAEVVIACIRNVIQEGGQFVAEFGGKGNVDTIVQSICKVLSEQYSIEANSFNS